MNVPSQQIVSIYPRNTCSSHPLCNFCKKSGKICSQVALSSEEYCLEHKELLDVVVTCVGITRNKNACTNKGSIRKGGKHYCPDHLRQAATEEEE